MVAQRDVLLVVPVLFAEVGSPAAIVGADSPVALAEAGSPVVLAHLVVADSPLEVPVVADNLAAPVGKDSLAVPGVSVKADSPAVLAGCPHSMLAHNSSATMNAHVRPDSVEMLNRAD